MIDLYTWGTPNGRKVSIALEEMGLDYRVTPIDIGSDAQHQPDFLAISPNNKIPAIVDGEMSLFESGAILVYLARKSGQFLPPEGTADYWQAMQWLMWQMGGYGPMLGQAHHFLQFNAGVSEYAEQRYHAEAQRLSRVLDTQLSRSEFLADEISIADFAIWPWTSRFDYQRIDLNDYPNLLRWYRQMAERPGVKAGYDQPNSGALIPMP